MDREGLEFVLVSLSRPRDRIAGYGPDGVYQMTDGNRVHFDDLHRYYGSASLEFFALDRLSTLLSELPMVDRRVLKGMV